MAFKFFGDPALLVRVLRGEASAPLPEPVIEAASPGLPRARAAYQATQAARLLELATLPSAECLKQLDAITEAPPTKPAQELADVPRLQPESASKEGE